MNHNYGSGKSSSNLKLRKHRVQMSADEILASEAIVHAIPVMDATSVHMNNEARIDNLSIKAIADAVREGELIEVNSFGRVVMRKHTVVVVFDVRRRRVVTTWHNNPNDNHKTLRMNEYTWNVNAVEYLKGVA